MKSYSNDISGNCQCKNCKYGFWLALANTLMLAAIVATCVVAYYAHHAT